MRDGLATPRYWWVQAKIIGIDGGYNSDPEYIPPPPSLPLVTERIHSPFQPKQSPSYHVSPNGVLLRYHPLIRSHLFMNRAIHISLNASCLSRCRQNG